MTWSKHPGHAALAERPNVFEFDSL